MKRTLGLTSTTLVLAVSSLSTATHYVSPGSTNPTPPYTNWATAAWTIQQAVDAAAAGDEVVVTNGVYPGGVTVTNALALLSVNGPHFTIINGGGTNRYASLLASGASLTGFTLTNGSGGVNGNAFVTNCLITGGSDSGAWGCTLYNCTLTGNSAGNSGGGAHGCTLYNCTLTGNSAGYCGGAVYGCMLYNCTLAGNLAGYGGGACYSTLHNCIVYFNTAPESTNYDLSGTLNYCCTTPLPTNGIGNIALDPLFVDYVNGNLRLQSDSPCVNAGNNTYVGTGTDLDGNARIVSGTVDMGAYEYQGTGSVISYAWLQQYGLPTDGSADFAHADADGMNNWQEWVCGTCPTNEVSALRLLSASPNTTNVTVCWQSVAGVTYFLERSADLTTPLTLLATNILGQALTTTYADTNAAGAGPLFYRVGVKCP